MRAPRLTVVLVLALALGGCGDDTPESAAPTVETSGPNETSPSEPPPPAPPPTPSTAPVSWETAGAFVWHETDVSPEALGQELRSAGFGWVAVLIHDGLDEDPIEDDWVERFRRASRLAVGGWGVLREQPTEEALLADALLARYGLDFYVANAEAEFDFGGPDGPSDERVGRSSAFVESFRRVRPQLPAALSSYCRPDLHDLDWAVWADAGFAFMPQAYVNDFGAETAPAVCVSAARGYFPDGTVHPTIGMYPGALASLRVQRYARLLEEARSIGFSVYLAETRMTTAEWSALGEAIVQRGVARLPAPP